MKINNQPVWDQQVTINSDPYGAAIVRFAEKWADVMETSMAAGAKLEDCADEACATADTEGITGFMYGCAVGILGTCWEHGNELRIWHNKKYGVSEEQAKGGTANPAVLTVG